MTKLLILACFVSVFSLTTQEKRELFPFQTGNWWDYATGYPFTKIVRMRVDTVVYRNFIQDSVANITNFIRGFGTDYLTERPVVLDANLFKYKSDRFNNAMLYWADDTLAEWIWMRIKKHPPPKPEMA